MNEQQLLRDPDIMPTNEVLTEALGAANNTYVEFVKGLQSFGIKAEWRYYNDGKAWLGKGLYKWTGARGGQNEVTAFWLSIWNGFFKVTFYIPEKARSEALNLSINNETKKMIESAKQIGKLKFFPLIFDLRSDDRFDDIFTLIDFRKSLK